jgi:hypothetical protein
MFGARKILDRNTVRTQFGAHRPFLGGNEHLMTPGLKSDGQVDGVDLGPANLEILWQG